MTMLKNTDPEKNKPYPEAIECFRIRPLRIEDQDPLAKNYSILDTQHWFWQQIFKISPFAYFVSKYHVFKKQNSNNRVNKTQKSAVVNFIWAD